MDGKDNVSYKLLCNACLCVGQALNLVTDVRLKRFYLEALNEIPLCNIADITPVLCWDCEGLLRRAISFKDQVKESYQVLLTYTNENHQEGLLTDISRSPRLAVKTNDTIIINPDEEVSADREPVLVKDELKLDWECDSVISLPESPTLNEKPSNTQRVYRKNDMKIEHNTVTSLPESPILNKQPLDTQRVYLKDDMKIEIDIDFGTDVEANHEDPEYEPDVLQIDQAVSKRKKKSKKGLKEKRTKKEKENKIKTIGEYCCPVCKTVYASVDSFTSHYKRHMRRYECSICQKRTMDLKVMQQHYFSTHEISLKEYKCADCGKISNSIDTHRYHRESHKARLQCSECEKTFRHRAGLLNHRLAVHEFKNKFPCNICNKIFKWRTSLRRHQDIHENKKPVAAAAYCALCGVNFSSLCSYQRHMTNSLKHITKDQLRFICDHCNIKFADKTKLRDHIEEKHLHKTFQCHICQKTSKNRVGLDQHIRNVHKGRPNNKMCHHCGKGFPTKVQLESHIRTHTGERPFICEYCPTTFSQQSNLYKHNRQVHLNMKSKRYPTCKKKVDSGPPQDAPMNPPPAVSVVLHYSAETGYLTAEL